MHRRPARLAVLVCRAIAWLLIGCSGIAHAATDGPAPIAKVHLTTGWVTFGQAVPKGAAPSGLAISGASTGAVASQTDVKTRWPDGSIRFAIVTAKIAADDDYFVTAASGGAGAFDPSALLPTASVVLTIGGTPYIAALPAIPSENLWLSGAQVYEGRVVVAPAAAGGAHPFLRVNFDVRVYNDGNGRVDVSVENVLDQLGATTVMYDVAVTVNGIEKFTQADVEHFYLTRWRKTFALEGSAFGAVTPDLAPFNQSRALPPYLDLVADRLDDMNAADYEILQAGALPDDMSLHGGRGALAPYPDWTARYLVHKRPEQLAFVLANGDLSGSWPIHVREPEASATPGVGTGRFVSLNQRPDIWLDERANVAEGQDIVKGLPLAIKEYTDICPEDAPVVDGETCRRPSPGQSRLVPDNAHQPSLAYVPYLMTGDRYYAEEMAFWANYGMLRTYNGDGVRGGTGILENNEVRGFGWALRNLADAAAYHPDPDVRAYLAEKVANNLAWLEEYVGTQPSIDGIPILWTGYRPEPGFISLWEQTYLAYAIDRANRLGFIGGLTHRDAIVRLQLTLFTSDPVYPLETTLPAGTTLPDGTVIGAPVLLTWGAPYLVGVQTPGTCVDADGNPFDCLVPVTTLTHLSALTHNLDLQRDYAGFYGPEARLNLMTAIDSARPGAQEAYDYLFPFIGAQNFWGDATTVIPDLAERAGWAIDFYPEEVAPPPPPPTPVAAALTSPAPGSTFASRAQLFTWSAGVSVARYKIDVGSAPGGSDLFAGTLGTALEQLVTGLPSDGRAVHVRLSSEIDGALQSADYAFVAFTNHAPVVEAIDPQSGRVGESFTFQVVALDEDGDSLTYTAAGLPAPLVINETTGLISGTPSSAGNFAVIVTVSDGERSGHASMALQIEDVTPPPPPPPPPADRLVNPGPQVNDEGDKVDFEIHAVPALSRKGRGKDDDRGIFSVASLPDGLQFDRKKGRIHGHIGNDAAQASPYRVTVTLTEGSQVSSVTFDWTVRPAGRGKSGKDR